MLDWNRSPLRRYSLQRSHPRAHNDSLNKPNVQNLQENKSTGAELPHPAACQYISPPPPLPNGTPLLLVTSSSPNAPVPLRLLTRFGFPAARRVLRRSLRRRRRRSRRMALFRRLFYRRPPEGLVEISGNILGACLRFLSGSGVHSVILLF